MEQHNLNNNLVFHAITKHIENDFSFGKLAYRDLDVQFNPNDHVSGIFTQASPH